MKNMEPILKICLLTLAVHVARSKGKICFTFSVLQQFCLGVKFKLTMFNLYT